jgi:hypothetical protein
MISNYILICCRILADDLTNITDNFLEGKGRYKNCEIEFLGSPRSLK